MNVVIPMAGRGKRFLDAGYNEPKPFIMVNGCRMINLVIQNLFPEKVSEHKIIFLCLEEFLQQHSVEFERYIRFLDYTIIPVKTVTEGAACTVLLAKDYIDNQEELIITDCDHVVRDYNHIQNGIDYFRRNDADGGLWCFINNHPKWSYVGITNNQVSEVAEKKVISNIANTGTYYFKHGYDFVDSASYMIQKKIKVNNEYYVAPVYNDMVSNNRKVLPYLVNEMVALGTPEDVEKYTNEARES